jgi:hypothetical protein
VAALAIEPLSSLSTPTPTSPYKLLGDVGSNHTDGHVFSPASPFNYVTRAQGTKVVPVAAEDGVVRDAGPSVPCMSLPALHCACGRCMWCVVVDGCVRCMANAIRPSTPTSPSRRTPVRAFCWVCGDGSRKCLPNKGCGESRPCSRPACSMGCTAAPFQPFQRTHTYSHALPPAPAPTPRPQRAWCADGAVPVDG